MMQWLVDCIHTHSSGDDYTDPCTGESAPGCQVDKPSKGAPSWAPPRLASRDPQVLRWASVINHLSFFLSGEILPSVSQWFRQGLRWWVIVQRLWDQGELPHVQQHWSHTQVEICHGLVGAHLWLNFGVWKWHVCTPARTHTHTYMQRVDACALKKTCGSACISKSVKVHTWELYLHLSMHLRMHASTQTCIYINNMTFSIKTKKNPDINFILSYSRCNQKQMSACLEGLFKHASGKIYGRV